jgi:hypothetical protein
VKNQQLREEFESTEAYSTLFMELVTNTDAAIEFINGVIPAGMAEEAAKLAQIDLKQVDKPTVTVLPKPEPRILTRKEITERSQEELDNLAPQFASGDIKLAE